MPEVIDVFGMQAEGLWRYVLAYGFPVLVFALSFWVAFKGACNVENGFSGDDDRDYGCDFSRGLVEDLRGVRDGSQAP